MKKIESHESIDWSLMPLDSDAIHFEKVIRARFQQGFYLLNHRATNQAPSAFVRRKLPRNT